MFSRILPILILASCAGLSGLLLLAFVGSDVPETASFTEAYLEYVAARGSFRPFQPRLSGPWRHAPYDPEAKPNVIGFEKLHDARIRRQIELEDQIRREADLTPTAAGRRAVCALLLIHGRLDDAIGRLEGLLAEGPDNAAVKNDLAAALLIRGDLEDRPRDYVHGLSLFAAGWLPSSRTPPVNFNLALLLERLHLSSTAREAWRRYLKSEKVSGWRNEAARRLRQKQEDSRLTAAGSDSDPSAQETRESAWNRDFADWAQALLAGDRSASEAALQQARRRGRLLSQISDNDLVNDSLTVIDQSALDPSMTRKLARGLQALAQGRRLFGRSAVQARERFLEALQQLEAARCPAWLWAEIGLAGADLYDGEFEAALERLDRVDRFSKPRDYPAVRGRAFWARGLIRVRQGRLTEALAHYGEARRNFERAREWKNLGAIENLLAENLRFLGRSEEAWRSWRRSAAKLHRFPGSTELHNALIEASDAVLSQGNPATALIFQQEDLALSRDRVALAEALNRAARLQVRLGQLREGARSLASANAAASMIPDPGLRETILQDIAISEVDLEATRDPSAARKKLILAERHYRRSGLELDVPKVLLRKARLEQGTGSLNQANEDLLAAIAELEARAASLGGEPGPRISHFGAVHEVYDEMVALQVDRGQPERALAFSERKRWALLHAGVGSTGGAPEWRDDWIERNLRRLPPKETLVEYALVGNRLLIWTIRRDGIRFEERSVDSESLQSAVRGLLRRIRWEGNEQSVDGILSRLYLELIAPIKPIEAGTTLVFLPDKFLRAVPFAALRGPDGRHLIELGGVIAAPSAVSYLASRSREDVRRPPARRILAVGDPAFDRGAFPWLTSLDGSREEAETVARLYPDAQLLLGDSAAKETLLAALKDSQILHFAGHAVSAPDDSGGGYLVVAPSSAAEDAGFVYSSDIHSMELPQLELVILSACATSASGFEEGFFGLAQPFLLAGAGGVVGTLWEVEDESAGRLMAELHRRLLTGQDYAAALRAVQLESLRQRAGVNRWAAFQAVIGGRLFNDEEE